MDKNIIHLVDRDGGEAIRERRRTTVVQHNRSQWSEIQTCRKKDPPQTAGWSRGKE